MKKKPKTLQGHYAGFVTRFVAFVIDIVIVMTITTVTAVVFALIISFFGLTPNENATSLRILLLWLAVVINTVLYFGYFVFFWMTSGQTPGKGLMGVRVIGVNGRPLSFVQAVVRLIGYWVSALVFFLGFIWITIDDQRQGWHDTMARTYVIYSWKATLHPEFLSRWRQRSS